VNVITRKKKKNPNFQAAKLVISQSFPNGKSRIILNAIDINIAIAETK